jgi:hypothetical protein
MNITDVNRQWASRPADQRFETLETLKASVKNRQSISHENNYDLEKLSVIATAEDGLYASVNGRELIKPTHWSFSQLCRVADAPTTYMRTLSPALTAKCLNYGIDEKLKSGGNDKTRFKFMTLQDPEGEADTLQAITSPQYGRIWDYDCVQAVENINNETGCRFDNPKEWSGKKGGLYASDRDVFIFMVDGGSIVDGGGERDQLHRGFFLTNSEVGSSALTISTFMFRYVCGNFMIWDAENINVLNIVHTSGAPARFVQDAMPMLLNFVQSSTKPAQEAIKRAKSLRLPPDEKEFIETFRNRGFSKGELVNARRLALEEEGQIDTVWDLINGLTANARSIAHIDARVDLEKRAGKLLELVEV